MPNPLTTKATELKAIRGKKTDSPQKIPRLPASLPKDLNNEWRGMVQHLQERQMWTDQKSGVAESYLVNLNAVRLAQRALADNDDNIMAGTISATIARHSAQVSKLASLLGLGAEKVAPAPVEDKKKVWNA